MRDHNLRGKRFCPAMKEWCTKGWTPSMGTNADGFPTEGVCAAWQPVSTFRKETNLVEEVFDCSVYGWPTDLMYEIANQTSLGTASTDKVATNVRKHHETFVRVIRSTGRRRQIESTANDLKRLSDAERGFVDVRHNGDGA